MIPLHDINPTNRRPYATWLLILINFVVFGWQLYVLTTGNLQQMINNNATVPANLTNNPLSFDNYLDMVRTTFFHGGFLHIFGNMLYLYLFGDNVEDHFGVALYLLIYGISAVVAILAHVAIEPNSTIPLVGASGAISGLLGSYIILYPRVKVRGVIPIVIIWWVFVEWSAWVVIGMWFGLQLMNGWFSLAETAVGGSTAFFAHIGGFLAGFLLTAFLSFFIQRPKYRDYAFEMMYDKNGRYIGK